MMRYSGLAAAALLVCGALWFAAPETESFAYAAQAIKEARTMSWRMRLYSRPDARTAWHEEARLEVVYRSPGVFRVSRYRDDKLQSVEIVDQPRNKVLFWDVATRQATWKRAPSLQLTDSPLTWSESLARVSLEFIGKRKVGSSDANVFRHTLKDDKSSFDVWIDTRTKLLLGFSSPGADVFDPDNKAGPQAPGVFLGTITDQISLDVEIEPSLLRLEPPAGYSVVDEPDRPAVTEAEMIDFLGATARFNDGTFADGVRGIEIGRYNAAAMKEPAARTDAENRLIELTGKHLKNGNGYPVWDFAETNAEPNSFRYLGKGVKLGSDQIVCYYKLKATGKYRAVYGDLSVRDVSPAELPLPAP